VKRCLRFESARSTDESIVVIDVITSSRRSKQRYLILTSCQDQVVDRVLLESFDDRSIASIRGFPVIRLEVLTIAMHSLQDLSKAVSERSCYEDIIWPR
jgi:hypothetical protein